MIKKLLLLLLVISLGILFVYSRRQQETTTSDPQSQSSTITSPADSPAANGAPQTTIATGLDTPWAIAFLPDNSMLLTERAGRIRKIAADGTLDPRPVATVRQVKEIGEGGLLGLTIHPNFSANNFVYMYYTYNSSGNDTLNRVVRMTYKNNQLSDEVVLVDQIPGASNHNGGRIKFGPDTLLYITTGDAQEPSQAQDTNSLAGKILRTTDTGQPAPNNPFRSTQGSSLVYSYGHRNPQGIAWDSSGRLWSTEHGRSGIPSGLDEINLIEPGKNYGWPEIQGDEQQPGMETAKLHSGSSTWAPADAAFIGQSLFFGGLRGQTLYEAVISGTEVSLTEHGKGEFGRIREVIAGPDGMLTISTSNRDGRGSPKNEDDRVIRVNSTKW